MGMAHAALARSAGAGAVEAGRTVLVVRDFNVTTLIGVHPEERAGPRMLRLDLEIEIGAARAAASDRLDDTVDYAAVVADVRAYVAKLECFLLERLAELVAARLVERFGARRVVVQAMKHGILENVGAVGVRIERIA